MNEKTWRTILGRIKPFRVVILAVFATVTSRLASPVDAQAVQNGITAEAKPTDLPLSAAHDFIVQATVPNSGMVAHLTQTVRQINSEQPHLGPTAPLEKSMHLKARMATSPYFDTHTIGMQVKIAF